MALSKTRLFLFAVLVCVIILQLRLHSQVRLLESHSWAMIEDLGTTYHSFLDSEISELYDAFNHDDDDEIQFMKQQAQLTHEGQLPHKTDSENDNIRAMVPNGKFPKKVKRFVHQDQQSKQSKSKSKKPEYLKDVTEDEAYGPNPGRNNPIFQRIKAKYPQMRARPIPIDRWKDLDDKTCVNPHTVDSGATWTVRAPYALVLGAQKAGSSALAKYLFAHPNVLRNRKELHFLSERMDMYIHHPPEGGLDGTKAYQHYLSHMQIGLLDRQIRRFHNDESTVVIDTTPTYLLKSDRVPHRVLCMCPWVKLIALFRDPVSRAYSQYNMEIARSVQRAKKTLDMGITDRATPSYSPTFEEWLMADFTALLETGVLLPETATATEWEAFWGSQQEDNAWRVYTKLETSMPIGRGLYSIQVRQFQDAYSEKGLPFPFLAIHSEDLKTNTEETYTTILDFLDLSHQMPKEFKEHHKRSYHHVDPMKNETRAFLQRLFRPYNDQLADLTGSDWARDW